MKNNRNTSRNQLIKRSNTAKASISTQWIYNGATALREEILFETVGNLAIVPVHYSTEFEPRLFKVGKVSQTVIPPSKKMLWEDIEKLFGMWDSREPVEDEIDDAWLDNLRSGWNRRLKEFYDSDDRE